MVVSSFAAPASTRSGVDHRGVCVRLDRRKCERTVHSSRYGGQFFRPGDPSGDCCVRRGASNAKEHRTLTSMVTRSFARAAPNAKERASLPSMVASSFAPPAATPQDSDTVAAGRAGPNANEHRTLASMVASSFAQRAPNAKEGRTLASMVASSFAPPRAAPCRLTRLDARERQCPAAARAQPPPHRRAAA